MREYKEGLLHGIPVALGYLSVSFAFGVSAGRAGLPLWAAVAVSMSCLTSAGQLAGLSVIAAAGGLAELALTQLVINLRYALMSISLSQKLDAQVRLPQRLLMAFGNTDELFAIAFGRKKAVTAPYFYGLMTLPYLCWALGTFLGAAADQLLPARVLSALGVAIYGMFVAIIVPVAKKNAMVAAVVGIAVALRCCCAWIPALSGLSAGFAIVLCAVIAAAAGAFLRPVGS